MTGRGPQRILYFDTSGRGGGAIVSLRTLVTSLDREEFAPLLVFGDRGNADRWGGEEVLELSYAGLDNFDFFSAGWNVRWLFHALRFVVHFPLDFCRVVLLLKRTRPALVHLNGGQAATFGLAARLLGVPLVWHVRELVTGNGLGNVLDAVYQFCAGVIIAPSEAAARRLPRCREKVRIIPNGVADAVALADEVVALRRNAGLKEGDFVVLLLGHIVSEEKGYAFLAEVAEKLGRLRNLRFLLAGHYQDADAPRYHRLLRRAYRLFSGGMGRRAVIVNMWRAEVARGRAYFTGYVDSAAAIACSSIVACPNMISEPFGRTVIEAYAMGKPVIASDVPALNEIVKHGVTGWLVPRDAEAWARTIETLYLDPELVAWAGGEASLAGRTYSAGHHAAQIMDVYRKVLS